MTSVWKSKAMKLSVGSKNKVKIKSEEVPNRNGIVPFVTSLHTTFSSHHLSGTSLVGSRGSRFLNASFDYLRLLVES